jgi:hypothetical protein
VSRSTAGWSRWAVLISSYRSTSPSDVVMIQMMSVNYAFTLSLVIWYPAYTLLVTQVCSRARGLNQPGQRPPTDTAGPQLPEACRLMIWRQDRTRSCKARGNNNPGTSFSAIAKKLKLINGHSVNCRAGCFKLKDFENCFGTPLHVCDTTMARES